MNPINKMNLEERNYADLIMGIDLGTTASAASVYTAGVVPRLCPLGDTQRTTMPSCVRWEGGDKFTVGVEAYNTRYTPSTVYSVKRLMGSDEVVTLTNPNDSHDKRTFTPAEISAKILSALVDMVHEVYPGINRCVITVPAYFSQRQIEDTIKASEIAGLDCVQLLKEPTSASYVYSNLGYVKDGSALIYDLGGGTFDATVLSFLKKSSISAKMKSSLKKMYDIDVDSIRTGDDNGLYFCRVLGTYGDTRLGGDDVDREMATQVAKQLGDKSISKQNFEKLVLRCEQFKKQNIFGMDWDCAGTMVKLTRSDLEHAIRAVFNRTLDIINTIPLEQLQAVKTIVLVGGSTKSDYLVDLIKEAFPDKEVSRVLDPDATVALGAGAVAKDLQQGKGAAYRDVLPMGIGILDRETTIDFCINKNTEMPYSTSRIYYTMEDNQEALSLMIYQGLSTDPAKCGFLGRIRIAGLPRREAGKVQVRVSFLLSAQGRLKITASLVGESDSEHELIIDSLFSVTEKDNVAASKEQAFDSFEEGIKGLYEDRADIVALVNKRREAILAGDSVAAENLETQIFEEL